MLGASLELGLIKFNRNEIGKILYSYIIKLSLFDIPF